MKLLTKFSLIFTVVFGLGLGVTAWISYGMLQGNARSEVLTQAELIMETASAVRSYTSERIKPALMQRSAPATEFQPETVPAFAATEMFNHVKKSKPQYAAYSYKEATLNPTNPRDRAADWEADVIQKFRNSQELASFSGERQTPDGASVFLARPIRAAKACLPCHSTPDAAPPEMVKKYGRDNGFNWNENEIVAAQIVSVPSSIPVEMANREFFRFMLLLGVIGVLSLIVLNLVLLAAVVRPVGRLAVSADEISKGNMNVEELKVQGKDEISVLTQAFNRMNRSLAIAMNMLKQDD